MKDLWDFMKERKKWWLLPFVLMLLLVVGLVMLAGHSAVTPFIYTIF